MIEQCVHSRIDKDVRKTNGQVLPMGHVRVAESPGFGQIGEVMDTVAGKYPSRMPDARGRFPYILYKSVLRDASGEALQMLSQAAYIQEGRERNYCLWHQYAVCTEESVDRFLSYPLDWMTQHFQSKVRDWRDFYLSSLPALRPQVPFRLLPLSQLLPLFGMSPKAFEVLLCSLIQAAQDPAAFVVVAFDDRAFAEHEQLVRQLLVHIFMMLPVSVRRVIGFETWLTRRMNPQQHKLSFTSYRFVQIDQAHNRVSVFMSANEQDMPLDISEGLLFLGNRVVGRFAAKVSASESSFERFITPWLARICQEDKCFEELNRLNRDYWLAFEKTPLGHKLTGLGDFQMLMDYQSLYEECFAWNWETFPLFARSFLAQMGVYGDAVLGKQLQKLVKTSASLSPMAADALETILCEEREARCTCGAIAELMQEYYRTHPISMEKVEGILLLAQDNRVAIDDTAWKLSLDRFTEIGWHAQRKRLRLAIGHMPECSSSVVSAEVQAMARQAALLSMPKDFIWNEEAAATLSMMLRCEENAVLLRAFVDGARLDIMECCSRLSEADNRLQPLLWNRLSAAINEEQVQVQHIHALAAAPVVEPQRTQLLLQALRGICRRLSLSEMQSLLSDAAGLDGEVCKGAVACILRCGEASQQAMLQLLRMELWRAELHREALLPYLNNWLLQKPLGEVQSSLMRESIEACSDAELRAVMCAIEQRHWKERLQGKESIDISELVALEEMRLCLGGDWLLDEVKVAFDKCKPENMAEIQSMVDVGERLHLADVAALCVIAILSARAWGMNSCLEIARRFLRYGHETLAERILLSAQMAEEDEEMLPQRLYTECVGRREDAQVVGGALAERLRLAAERIHPSLEILCALVQLVQEEKMPLEEEVLVRLMQRTTLRASELEEELERLRWMMNVQLPRLALCAQSHGEMLAVNSGADISAIQTWCIRADRTDPHTQHILGALLSGLPTAPVAARQNQLLRIFQIGLSKACDPHIERILAEGECITEFRDFYEALNGRSVSLHKAVIRAICPADARTCSKGMAFMDELCSENADLIPDAFRKAEELVPRLEFDGTVYVLHSVRSTELGRLAKDHLAMLLMKQSPVSSAHSDNMLYEDFRSMLAWLAGERADLIRSCGIRVLEEISGESISDGRMLIEQMAADLDAVDEELQLEEPLAQTMVRCLRSERTELPVPQDALAEYERIKKHSRGNALLHAWLEACLRSGCFTNAEFFSALVPALNGLLGTEAYSAVARECFLANILPRLQRSMQERSSGMNTIDINLDINRVEGFGKPIEDEGIRLAVLARCLHIPGSENIVIALTNSIVRRVKSVPPENTKMMPALLWATKWFFALMDEYAEDRRMYTALAQRCSQAYSASRAKYSTVAVDVSVQMVQLPFWNTLKAAQNMAAVLRECMSSTTDNCTQEDRYFSNLARLDGRLAETGVYREGVWAYIRPMIGRMAEHIVQDVFLHKPPQNVPWLHLDPQNLPGTLLRQFLLADWKSREIRECGFQSICCAYVKLISNSETLRQMYWQEPLRVEEGDPLLENPPDRETLLAFMTLRLLSRSCADPEVLHRAMLVQYGEDALQETWQQAVRYACRMGGLWMSWQIRQGPVLEGLTQEQMRAYERYVYILVCAKNAEGLREAVRFAVQYHVQGIAEALVHYRSIPGYEDFASVQLAGLEGMPGKPLLAGFTEGLHVGTE